MLKDRIELETAVCEEQPVTSFGIFHGNLDFSFSEDEDDQDLDGSLQEQQPRLERGIVERSITKHVIEFDSQQFDDAD